MGDFRFSEDKTYSSVGSAESVQLRLGRALELIFGDDTGGNETLHGVDGNVPHLLVLFLQEEDNTRGLSVERAGHMENRVANNLLNGIVGDGALRLEAVVGAAGLDQLQQAGGGRVLEFRLSGAHCVFQMCE